MKTAKVSDFKVGNILIDKVGKFEIKLLKRTASGIWEGRGISGVRSIFESEASAYFIKEEKKIFVKNTKTPSKLNNAVAELLKDNNIPFKTSAEARAAASFLRKQENGRELVNVFISEFV